MLVSPAPSKDFLKQIRRRSDHRCTDQRLVESFEAVARAHGLNALEMIEALEADGKPDLVDQIVNAIVRGRQDEPDIFSLALHFYSRENRYARGVHIAAKFRERFPDIVGSYNFLAYAFKYSGQAVLVREVIASAYHRGLRSIFFQAAARPADISRIGAAAANDHAMSAELHTVSISSRRLPPST